MVVGSVVVGTAVTAVTQVASPVVVVVGSPVVVDIVVVNPIESPLVALRVVVVLLGFGADQ